MKFPQAVRKLRRNFRDHGWKVTARKAVGALFRLVYENREYRIYRIDLGCDIPSPHPLGQFTFRLLGCSDIAEISQIEAMEDWLAGSMHERLAQGSVCLAALDGPHLAGFNLISFGRVTVPVINWTRTFRRDFAWSAQISTAPEYRRQGLASELRYRIFAELKWRGFKRLYGGALALNHASLSLARKVGFEEIVAVRLRKLLAFSRLEYCRARTKATCKS